MKTLLDNGMSIQRVRRAWKYLSKNGNLISELSEVKLVSDGETIYSVQEEQVFDSKEGLTHLLMSVLDKGDNTVKLSSKK